MVLCGGCGPGDQASDGGSIGACGDGVKHEEELCDDGNLIPGDGCSPECLPSGMPHDCVDLVVQDNLERRDSVEDLLPLADGTFIAVGQLDQGPGNRWGWLGRFEPSGARRWFVDASTLDVSVAYVSRISGDEQAGVWAVGKSGAGSRDHLLRFDLDGNLIGSVAIESEMGERVDVRDIEVTEAGVWIAGGNRPDGQFTTDMWLGLYDPSGGTIRDQLREDHLGYEDTVNAVVRDGEGVAIAATVSTSPNTDGDVMLEASTDIIVAWFDQHGTEHARATVGPSPDPNYVRHASQLAVDESGRWFVGGPLVSLHSQAWVAQVGGTWAWTSTAAGVTGLVGVHDGIVVAAPPPISSDPSSYRSWVGEFAWDGAVRWEFDADYK
ncbi:MAG: hypothetical protein R6X02_18980, partial [Enhygromyxa sp.]